MNTLRCFCVECGEMFPDFQCFELHGCSARSTVDADPINHPSHYTQGGIQPIDFIVANKLNFIEGSILKYLVRYKYKSGLEDLKKAKAYLERLIKLEEGKGGGK